MSVPQQRNMVWLMIGIYLSRNVQLSKIVKYIASSAKEKSVVRRISRFLAQFGADVKTSYAKQIVPILKCRVASKTKCFEIKLDFRSIFLRLFVLNLLFFMPMLVP